MNDQVKSMRAQALLGWLIALDSSTCLCFVNALLVVTLTLRGSYNSVFDGQDGVQMAWITKSFLGSNFPL